CRISSSRSATAVRRAIRIPCAASARAISAPFVSSVKPRRSSVPIATISTEDADDAGDAANPSSPPSVLSAFSAFSVISFLFDYCPIPIEILQEGVHRKQCGERESDGDESAVELVPVLRESAMLPAHGLAGIAEGEPEDDRSDEDVLNRGLELPSAAGGNDHAAPARPPAENGHGHLPPDE